ncbi:MAG: hypothetical protein IKL98_08455, partial [Akkermansia sp.]|nr:hypothetical protein [Akkermansia sp.]
PACGLLPDVYLYDTDTLQRIAENSHHARCGEIERAEQLIDAWVHENLADLLTPRMHFDEKLEKN